MQLIERDDSISFETRIPLANFSSLVNWHLDNVPENNALKTLDLESQGKSLIATDFSNDELKHFICQVCHWGGYAGISGRVLKNNESETIRSQFLAAYADLKKGSQHVGDALSKLNHLSGLSTPSFASKHLRFLSPENCPVLDAKVAKLGYNFTPRGYQTYADDCQRISGILEERGITNPIPQRNGEWFVGDVDMAIFAYLNGTLDNVPTE